MYIEQFKVYRFVWSVEELQKSINGFIYVSENYSKNKNVVMHYKRSLEADWKFIKDEAMGCLLSIDEPIGINDVTGKPIYEGDMVILEDSENNELEEREEYVVYYDINKFKFSLCDVKDTERKIDIDFYSNYRIIGDRYE